LIIVWGVMTACPEQCSATDLSCNPPSRVEIASPIDSVMAVGRSAQLSASAKDANQNDVGTSFTWNSSASPIATVNPAGLVSAVGAGATIIRATATGSSVFGSYPMRVVSADLPGVSGVLADPWVTSVRGALGPTAGGTVNGLVDTCLNHVATGHILALDDCLNDIRGVGGGSLADQALLTVLGALAAHAAEQLSLDH
jgi:hypothetical protein